ncbi:MAG TPA: HAD-IB family phosphatase [Kofleriaceae bacterium]|jgi:HAD superfamily phosphoserine phosphatase-like hydrolase|nr:HAD-IB family phosphatase [Kofleriaceae bacterium]
MHDPLRITRFNVHRRIADRYVDGRVFLAGDAAHIHSPAGGQGMMFSFQRFWFERTGGALGTLRRIVFEAKMRGLERRGVDRAKINARFYQSFRGRRASQVHEIALAWYDTVRKQTELYIESAVAEAENHVTLGGGVVLVSGSFRELRGPIATRIGACDILATNLEAANGIYTGRIIPLQTIGIGKAVVVGDYLRRQRARSELCYAYGDHESDLPMLGAVGNAAVVGDDRKMVTYATTHGWRVLAAT